MALYACILAEIERGQAIKVRDALSEVDAVGLVAPTAGPFDLLIWAKGNSAAELGKSIISEIQTVSGVKSTLSLFMLEDFTPIHWLKDLLSEEQQGPTLTDTTSSAMASDRPTGEA